MSIATRAFIATNPACHDAAAAGGESLADRVYAYVTDCILSGEWVSGDVIDRRRIAATLNVSLAPVAEAVIRLDAEGFLETAPRRHTRVRVVRRDDVRDQFALRMAIERQAIAMGHGEPVRRLRHHLVELAEAVDSFRPKDPAAWPSEIAFHQALVDLAASRGLSISYNRVMRRNYFFSLNSAQVVLDVGNPPANQHTLLVEGLCTDDSAVADRLIVAHYAIDIGAMLKPR
jgi:GntR family transcriptional regulator, rspAB operon transcriptional repressor